MNVEIFYSMGGIDYAQVGDTQLSRGEICEALKQYVKNKK